MQSSHDQLAAALKELRRAAGLSAQALGDRLGWSQGKVSKMENGATRKPARADVAAWLRATGAGEQATTELLILADEVQASQSWATNRRRGMARRQEDIAGLERRSTLIREFQPSAVPGLLQVADYAQRIFEIAGVPPADIPETVMGRMNRQNILFNRKIKFEYVLAEPALRWRPGPADAMRFQADRILQLVTLPNISIGVIPFNQEARVLQVGSFVIFDTPDGTYVLRESPHGADLFSEPKIVEIYDALFGRLQDEALTGSAAAKLIRSAALWRPAD
jgi:transcriptional regulator with XRE-family HTH domain